MGLLKSLGRMRRLWRKNPKASLSRIESNRWLREHCATVTGRVLSIGTRDDLDGEGACYRDYFVNASEYVTSDVVEGQNVDLVLDVRSMPAIKDGAFDCVYCSGVLEHVDDIHAAVRELHRVISAEGVLLLGLPLRQAIHDAPMDYWRFTRYGIEFLLADRFEVVVLDEIDLSVESFPAAYWCVARKIGKV